MTKRKIKKAFKRIKNFFAGADFFRHSEKKWFKSETPDFCRGCFTIDMKTSAE